VVVRGPSAEGCRTNGDRNGGIHRQVLGGLEGQPAPFLSVLDQVFHLGIRLDFVFVGEHQADRLAAGTDLDGFQDGSRIDALVEGNEEERVNRLRNILRVGGDDFGRRCAESPGDRLCERPAMADLIPAGMVTL